MSVSEAHKRASYKYNTARDNIMIRPAIDEGAAIRKAAKLAGVSIQRWVLDACREKLEK